jgi:hypothetical protein
VRPVFVDATSTFPMGCGLTIRSSRSRIVAALRALRYASAHRRLLCGSA